MSEKICLMGFSVDNLSLSEAIQRAVTLVEQARRDNRPRLIATANVDFIVQSQGERRLLQALRTADVITADGMPLVGLSRLLGSPLKARVTGVDLVVGLAAEGSKRGWTMAIIGGDPGVAQRAATALEAKNKGLRVVAIETGRVCGESLQITEEDQKLLEQLASLKPDVLLIALGNPKQEIWWERVKAHLHVPLSIGVGGTVKFLAGVVKRAPVWVQRLGLEWVYRLACEPRNLLLRYMKDLILFPLLIIPLIAMSGFTRLNAKWGMKRERETLKGCVKLPRVVDVVLWQANASYDCSEVAYITPKGVAALVKMQGLRLHRVPISICLLLRAHRIYDLLRVEA